MKCYNYRQAMLRKHHALGLRNHTTTFGYDVLDRLSSEAGPARTQSFTLDANGNRLSDGQGSKTYSPNSNRMATLDGHSVVLDAAGHTLQARGLVFAWNQAGQLKSVSQGPTLLASYFYDHRGLRTRKTTTAAAPQGAGTVIYHHDAQGHLLAETTAAGAPLRTYVWRESANAAANAAANAEADPDAQPTPQVIIDHTASGPDGHPLRLYLQTDHLGSPVAARDHSGRLVWAWHSEAFGASAPDEDPDGDGTPTTIHLRFPGQYFDTESALHYNWHRYYDPSTGRYLSPDPIGIEGGSNLFGYVGVNPLSQIDPNGLDAIIAHNGTATYYNSSGQVVGNYQYTTGRPGATDTRIVGQGPIPFGTYTANPSQISEGGFFRNLLGDWGRFRVPLKPDHGTQTFGRDGFFLHGGKKPGSAGCIDVGGNDSDLFGNLRNAPGLVPVVVY
jgi:RHS repeat-associated protein